jgi:geranylgeranyl pyrophosphate synthase
VSSATDRARERVARRPRTIFDDYARDAAAAFGNPDAAAMVHEILAAAIEGIRILDDIQDDEPQCLATEIGVEAATAVAQAALEWSIELAAALPCGEAAAAAIDRGIRDTAFGQHLEITSAPTFDSYWNVVDHKTPPLVAAALELGALAAGAPPARAAALTRLALPLGRLLQISDDCTDALGPGAPDRRAPHRNLLMLYGLTGSRGAELSSLLQDAEDVRAAQILLVREGALAYAMHAEWATLDDLAATIAELDLPDPSPFLRFVEEGRAEVAQLS